MFARKPQTEPSELDQVIADALSVLNDHVIGSDEYGKALDQLTKLYALKTPEPSSGVNPDTLATVLGNLAGILIIVGHERANVISSKALAFVMKAAR